MEKQIPVTPLQPRGSMRGRPVGKLSLEQTRRFWKRVDVRGVDECWPWLGGRYDSGYGAFYVNGQNTNAARVSCSICNGEIPKGMLVLHSCDNPPCCNPFHLRSGTHKENSKDMADRGRRITGDAHWARRNPDKIARGDKSGARLHPENLSRGDDHYSRKRPEVLSRGDNHYSRVHPEKLARGINQGNSRFSEKDILDIREKYYSGEFTQVEIAAQYSAKQGTISNIINKKSWKHI